MGRSLRVPLLLFVGALLLQSAWILTLPPFRGTDEFDHAYHAAAVAGGQWSIGETARHGRGKLVVVPRTLVEAAHPVCSSYGYTGHDNCNPVTDVGDGRVEVASAAATYNPAFYWVVGTAAAPFEGDGDAALYAMRIAAALLCALFLALAGWVTTKWARTVWPLVALVAGVTPVMVFSISVAAPNGLEMCAALTVWMALLGLHSTHAREQHATSLLVTATVSATVLTTLRSIGPLWLLLIVATMLLSLSPRQLLDLVRPRRALTAICTAVVLAATVASAGWTTSAGTSALEPQTTEVANRWTASLSQFPLWILQGIAAFPRRMDAAPALVYVLVGLTVLVFVVVGFTAAPRRLRVTMAITVLLALAVPVALTVPTIRITGPIWQGRYGLPYHLGLTLLAGLALDVRRFRHRWVPAGLVAGWLAVTAANVLAVLHVLAGERSTSPLAQSSAWVRGPAWMVALMLVLGFAAWGAAGVVTAQRGAMVRRSASVDA